MTNSKKRRLATVVGYIVVVCALMGCRDGGPSSDQDDAVPKLDNHIPRDVGDVQPGLLPNDVQSQLDHLSWQTFIALNWPANANVPIGQAPNQPRVWELYSDPVEFFQPDLAPTKDGSGTKVLYMKSKKVELIRDPDIIDQAASGKPVIDQFGNYAVYEIRSNPVQKQDITQAGLQSEDAMIQYAQGSQNPVFRFTPGEIPEDGGDGTVGAIELKAAWRIFPEDLLEAHPEILDRYHHRPAWIYTDGLQSDSIKVTVGLIGLHIAHKTKTYPQWLWATFEHVDNYERGPEAPAWLNPTFNDGETPPNYATDNREPKPMDSTFTWNDTTPFATSTSRPQVTRCVNEVPIPHEVNAMWQEQLKGTPWQYYRLNATQWVGPANANEQKLVAFPQNDEGVSIVRNSVLETYLLTWNNQKTVTTGGNGLPPWKKGTPIDPTTLASQVFFDRVTDLEAIDNQLYNYLIPATVEVNEPKPEDAKYRGTWSSCVLCHQDADWEVTLSDSTLKVSTDMSFLFKSFLQDVQ